ICSVQLSEFAVILPQSPTLTEQMAAEELTAHLDEAAGIQLPVHMLPCPAPAHGIYIGRAAEMDRSGISHDGYVIAAEGKNLCLFGAVDRGTLYAVYRFLEKYIGFRKYEPGVGRLLPGDADIPQGLYDASSPVFSDRFTNWASHVKDTAFAAWEGITYALPGVENYGGYAPTVGWCHTFESLCDPRLYFETHPEYYSLWEGRRIPAGNTYDESGPAGQLCLTNPDVLKIVIESVRNQLEKTPGAALVEVSQNDNGRYCQCENCAAVDAEEGSPSGLMLRFVNAVAENLEKDYPHVLVRTFAYQYTRRAPKITRPHKNIIIRYCTIEACFQHGLDAPDCERNDGVFGRELREWSEICDKISVWDYTRNFSCYFAPVTNFDTLRDNARFFAENHVIHLFEQDTESATYTGDLGSLKAYLLARLLWNPYMDEAEYEAHIADFLEGYFGPGWRNIRRYMRLLGDAARDRHMACFEPADIAWRGSDPLSEQYLPEAYQDIREDSYLSKFIKENLDEALALWDGALAQAEDDGQRERIRRSRLSPVYLDLFCRRHEREKMTPEQRADYEAAAARFFEEKEAFGCHYNLWT
ncbi:MAG: DUF4838 domain-containing protein, partial [Lentisphaerae bacterium]|nr:DUF4838 domain-containing protein [Lentisphaerota bacterium]